MPGQTPNVETIGWYTAADVARLAGVTPQRVGQWARHEIILPSVSTRPNIYSYADAGEAILAHYLVREGKQPKEVRDIVVKLREQYGPWPLANAPLEHDGALVMRRNERGELVAIERPGQEVIGGTLLNLKEIREALGRGGWVAIDNPREHIEVNPDRHSGVPVVRGRRIPTAMVAAVAAEPDGRDILREDYDLTDAEINDAIGYESDLSELVAA